MTDLYLSVLCHVMAVRDMGLRVKPPFSNRLIVLLLVLLFYYQYNSDNYYYYLYWYFVISIWMICNTFAIKNRLCFHVIQPVGMYAMFIVKLDKNNNNNCGTTIQYAFKCCCHTLGITVI